MNTREEIALQLALKCFDHVAALDGKDKKNRNIDLAQAAAECYNTIYENLTDKVTTQ